MLKNIRAEAKGLDFQITPETFKYLHKSVFKDMCQKWGCAKMILICMNLEESVADKCIASSFKDHLNRPQKKKPSAIYRFFCKMGKGVSKSFNAPSLEVGFRVF